MKQETQWALAPEVKFGHREPGKIIATPAASNLQLWPELWTSWASLLRSYAPPTASTASNKQ
jgi:hypothetical protein